MTEDTTPVELGPNTEIRVEPEGTPRSIDLVRSQHTGTGRQYMNGLVAIAAATQIFGWTPSGMTDELLYPKDITQLIDGDQAEYPPVWYPSVSADDIRPESSGELANRTRLELLARRYVSKKLTPEEDARLAIVIEQVRRLIPRVTADDFEALGEIARESEGLRLENMERRRRLSL